MAKTPEYMLSHIADEWQQLSDFESFLRARFYLAGDSVNGSTSMQDAAKYLSYIREFKRGQWKEVEEYYAANADENGKIAVVAPHPSVKIDKVTSTTVQFRLFFAYAARYTIRPFDPVSIFLKDYHDCNADEWRKVLATLDSEEEEWAMRQ